MAFWHASGRLALTNVFSFYHRTLSTAQNSSDNHRLITASTEGKDGML